MHLLSVAFAAVPFVFGLIRAVETGDDVRYLWVALAALGGALVVVATGKALGWGSGRVVALFAGVFVAATLCAMMAASALGVRVGPGMLVVGVAFAFCFAASGSLHVVASHRRP
jgi:hypothetical protein